MNIPLWASILVQIVLIALNAIFASAEIAVIEIKGPKLDTMAEEGNKKAKKLKKLSDDPARFLATIQVAITLSGFLASAFASENFSEYIVKIFENMGLSDSVMDAIKVLSVIVVTLLLSYITLIFGELVPKRVAMKKTEKTALGLADTVGFVSVAFKPLVSLLTVSTNGVLRLLRINPDEQEDSVSEEDIRMMADAGSETGVIDESENEIIQNVFEFDDISADKIATHRTEMTVLWEEDGDKIWENTIRDNPFRFFPICREDIDHITGVLDAGKYLRLSDHSRENVLKEAVMPAVYVSDSMKADDVFKKMKQEKFRFAVVVDEYGGTYGILTRGDVVEEIIGSLDDDGSRLVKKQGKGFTVSALAPRSEFEKLFDVEIGEDSATVGGWVCEVLEHLPAAGEEFEFDGIHVKVTKADSKRVIEVYAEKQ